MLKPMFSAAVALTLAVPATAQTPPPADGAPAATQKLKDPDRIICERQEEIGSRLGGKKICKTAREWQDWRQQNRDQLQDWQQRLTQTGKGAG